MKQKKNAVLGLLALVLLAAGGIAVYFGMHSDKVVHAGEEVVWADGTVLYLTDQADTPEMREMAATGSGIFFDGRDIDPSADWQGSQHALKYYDSESGETVYLCARPNCLHGGDEFCPASTKNYQIVSNLVWFDGYLYAAALDQTAPLSQSNAKDSTVLLRYAADGTEITKVADLHTVQRTEGVEYYSVAVLTVHRGQFWIKCEYTLLYPPNDILDLNKTGSYSGYEMLVWSPDTGSITKLFGTDELSKSFQSSGCYDFRGIGDYIYFRKTEEFKNPFKGLGLFRINCRTGETEQLVSVTISAEIAYYAVLDDRIFYWMEYKTPNNSRERTLHIYDLNTKEDTVISKHDSQTTDDEMDIISRVDSMIAADDAVVLLHTGIANPEADLEDRIYAIYAEILDRDGNLIQTAVCDQSFTITDEHIIEVIKEKHGKYYDSEEEMAFLFDDFPDVLWNASYANGTLYIPSNKIMVYAAELSDIMTGTFELTPIYEQYHYK